MTPRPRHIAHLHLHAHLTEESWADIVETLTCITPTVQVLPPDAVQLDLTGAVRYFDRAAVDVLAMIKMRMAALFGIEVSAGLAPNRLLAAMAAAESAPGATTIVSARQDEIDVWLHPLPVAALPGVGPATALSLRKLGVRTIGQITELPPATLQRALASAPAARQLAERARGRDARPVSPGEATARLVANHVTTADELDPAEHHRAVLALAGEVGARLRDQHLVAGLLTLTLRYADHSSSTRTRRVPEATAHSPALAAVALGALTSLNLQRARVRAYTLRADQLLASDKAHRQLRLDPGGDQAHAAEAAADRARRRFGDSVVGPATLASRIPSSKRQRQE